MHVAEYAKKWKSLYRVLRKNVALNAVKYAAQNGFEAVTCGHTHYPEDMVVDGIRYINTGAWTELPAHYLHITGDGISLNTVHPSNMIQGAQSCMGKRVATPIPYSLTSPGSAGIERCINESAP